jgi:Ni/Co efflux regulator RcnB
MTSSAHSAIGSLACIIGRNVGGFLDTQSPRLVTYRVTSTPFVYVDEDNGAPLHDHPTTESFQFTVTMHPDGSVEGVTTMETHLGHCVGASGQYYPLNASCFFSASEERTTSSMHYETDLDFKATQVRTFEDVEDLEERAAYAAAKTEKLQAMLAASKVCTMVFEHNDNYDSERAQVTILKAPFRIDVSRWSRGAHFFPDDERRDQYNCNAAHVDFEVATIELVKGMAVERPVFS